MAQRGFSPGLCSWLSAGFPGFSLCGTCWVDAHVGSLHSQAGCPDWRGWSSRGLVGHASLGELDDLMGRSLRRSDFLPNGQHPQSKSKSSQIS